MMAYGEQTTLAERKRRAASRLILGFDGLTVPPEIRKFCRDADPAGFVLFKRNVESVEQLFELNRELKSVVRPENPPILSVDQEGGRVLRVRESEWPPMRWVGNLKDLQLTKKVARSMVAELQAMGFNTNWAPVADVDSNPKNPIIGDRSFSNEPGLCAQQVVAFIEEMEACGMISCAKHFPGHGDTDIDSHLDLPTVEKDPPDIERCELLPFKEAVAANVPIIMTAHVVFPAFDEAYPATMSEKILNGILRKQLGFQNVIVSDDMEMKAVRGRWPLEEQLDLSCRATVDLFLVCSDMELQWNAFETLVYLQEQDNLHNQLAIDSFRRLQELRKRYFLEPNHQPPLDIVGSANHRSLCSFISQQGAS